jgi:GNAT superfamily N-acetyltransferase
MTIRPVGPERWGDLERLFGPSGAYSGCWCMFWRVPSGVFSANGNAGNRRALRRLVSQNAPPGLLAYDGQTPVGWVSVAPRERFLRLERSPKLKRVDHEPVWSIVCFFVAKSHRRRGVMAALIEGAVAHVKRQGGRLVEAYPQESSDFSGCKGYMGLVPAFRRAGFSPVAPAVRGQVVMRRRVE